MVDYSLLDYSLPLKIKGPQFDLAGALQTASQLRQAETNIGLGQLRLRQANEQQGALSAFNAAAERGDPRARDALRMYPELQSQVMANEQTAETANLTANARAAMRVKGYQGQDRIQAWQEELDQAVRERRLPPLVHQRLRGVTPTDQMLDGIIGQAQKPTTDLERAHAEYYRAQAEAARAKQPDTFDLGPDHTRFRYVPDPSAPAGVRAVPIATGPNKAEKPPSGYETDPGRPGGLRPIAGGPADKIIPEQAARVALITEGIKDMPAIREAFGVRLVPDETAPNGVRAEAVPGEFGVSKAPLGPSYDPVAYAQYYGGLGKVGEGQRRMSSAMEGVLRTLTGAAATKEEVARELTKYMPFPTDSLQTRADKLAMFERNLRAIAEMSAHGTSGAAILDMLKSGGAKALNERAPTAKPNPTTLTPSRASGVPAGSPGSRESPVFVRTPQDAQRLPPGVFYRTPPDAQNPEGRVWER